MSPHQEVSDVARQYIEATRELREVLAERERLVAQYKATGIRPTLALTSNADRIHLARDLTSGLRQVLDTLTSGGDR